MDTVLTLAAAGLLSGILAGFLGIGGGTLLVPVMVQLGFEPRQAVATSSLTILMTASAGSWQNWRMGELSPKKAILIGIPALVTAQIGVLISDWLPEHLLLLAFGLLLLSNVYLVGLKRRVIAQQTAHQASSAVALPAAAAPSLRQDLAVEEMPEPAPRRSQLKARLFTGGAAGLLAGIFGVGGGIIMVPLQILLLGEDIKTAVRTSLGVIVITALSATVGHAIQGNVQLEAGLVLGLGGFVGAQVSTRFLPKLSNRLVNVLFRAMLVTLAGYIFWQAWQSYGPVGAS